MKYYQSLVTFFKKYNSIIESFHKLVTYDLKTIFNEDVIILILHLCSIDLRQYSTADATLTMLETQHLSNLERNSNVFMTWRLYR